MPPKRKRSEDGAAGVAAKATRASSRLQGSTLEADMISSGVSMSAENDGEHVKDAPAPKKARRAATTKTGKKKSAKGTPVPNKAAGPSDSDSTQAVKAKASAPEPYSEARAKQLFKTYEDQDSPGEIGPDGFEKLCADLAISLEGALPLVLAWQLNGTEMAKFTEDEWTKGTAELRVSNLQTLSLAVRDLEDLLLLNTPPIQPQTSAVAPAKKGPAMPGASDPYDRRKYYAYAASTDKAFSELYTFCFNLAKPPSGRNIDIDTASAFWTVLVAPKYPIMHDILKFIAEKGTYKGVNKDLWHMTLEFCRTVQPDLSNYDPDGAWPTMLDDFVSWKKSSNPTEDTEAQDVDVV